LEIGSAGRLCYDFRAAGDTMDTAITDRPMAKTKGRPKKPGGEGTPVRIDTDLVTMARYVAAREGVPISELLSGILRPTIERKFRKAAPKVEGSEG
jgi:hypothetical protein